MQQVLLTAERFEQECMEAAERAQREAPAFCRTYVAGVVRVPCFFSSECMY